MLTTSERACIVVLDAILAVVLCPACGGESSPLGDGGSGATVAGTLTLPGAASGKPYSVKIMTMPGLTSVAEANGTTTGSTTLPYTIGGVAAGTYFILGFVDVDSSGGTSSTPGDYRGWYGHGGDGNPPSAPNATVPSSGAVGFDFSLVLAPARTPEVCKADTDCKMEPDGICKDEKTVVRFDVPRCGDDRQCTWIGTEVRCGLRCEAGYCITARGR